MNREFLFGIVIGLHDVQHAPDMAPDPDGGLPNSGITVVLPIRLVMETIEQKGLMEKRMESLTEARQESGSRPASANSIKSEPPTTEGDEQHRERFTSLLDAVARKHPPTDQT
jgi:hypothetical protein